MLDESFNNALQDSGTWIIPQPAGLTAYTTSDDARLRIKTSHAGFKIFTVGVQSTVRDEWQEVGFTNPDYTDRVYAKFKYTTTPSELSIEWRETVDGTDALIDTQVFSVSASAIKVWFFLFFHNDLKVISGRIIIFTSGGISATVGCRQSFTVDAATDWCYAGTGTITGTVTLSEMQTRECYGHTGDDTNYEHTDRAPAEWEIDLSGVALGSQQLICTNPFLGTTYYGYYDFYDEFNDVHVATALNTRNGFVSTTHLWRLDDSYTWSDPAVLPCFNSPTKQIPIIWRVWAFFITAATSFIDTGGVSNEPCGPSCGCDINPSYSGKPGLFLKVEAQYTIGTAVYRATWAAIVESDWTGCADPSCQQTPSLSSASCGFDWRTISQQQLTFICIRKYTSAGGYLDDTNTGIDWSGSDLYISAIS